MCKPVCGCACVYTKSALHLLFLQEQCAPWSPVHMWAAFELPREVQWNQGTPTTPLPHTNSHPHTKTPCHTDHHQSDIMFVWFTCVYGGHLQKTLERESRGCQHLILWTDCDREGENIAFEIVEVCNKGIACVAPPVPTTECWYAFTIGHHSDHALGMESITRTCQPLGCLVCVSGGCGCGCGWVYVSGGYTCCVDVVECEWI